MRQFWHIALKRSLNSSRNSIQRRSQRWRGVVRATRRAARGKQVVWRRGRERGRRWGRLGVCGGWGRGTNGMVRRGRWGGGGWDDHRDGDDGRGDDGRCDDGAMAVGSSTAFLPFINADGGTVTSEVVEKFKGQSTNLGRCSNRLSVDILLTSKKWRLQSGCNHSITYVDQWKGWESSEFLTQSFHAAVRTGNAHQDLKKSEESF